jgi:hypothetical protein
MVGRSIHIKGALTIIDNVIIGLIAVGSLIEGIPGEWQNLTPMDLSLFSPGGEYNANKVFPGSIGVQESIFGDTYPLHTLVSLVMTLNYEQLTQSMRSAIKPVKPEKPGTQLGSPKQKLHPSEPLKLASVPLLFIYYLLHPNVGGSPVGMNFHPLSLLNYPKILHRRGVWVGMFSHPTSLRSALA